MAIKEAEIKSRKFSLDEKQEAFIAALQSRTPEEIAEARAHLIAQSPIPRSLPPGKTLEDVFVGALPDNEDEAVIIAALADMD